MAAALQPGNASAAETILRHAACRADTRSAFLPADAGERQRRKPPLLFVHGGYCDAWWLVAALPALVRGPRATRRTRFHCAAMARPAAARRYS
jgi:hypothetical protein